MLGLYILLFIVFSTSTWIAFWYNISYSDKHIINRYEIIQNGNYYRFDYAKFYFKEDIIVLSKNNGDQKTLCLKEHGITIKPLYPQKIKKF